MGGRYYTLVDGRGKYAYRVETFGPSGRGEMEYLSIGNNIIISAKFNNIFNNLKIGVSCQNQRLKNREIDLLLQKFREI